MKKDRTRQVLTFGIIFAAVLLAVGISNYHSGAGARHNAAFRSDLAPMKSALQQGATVPDAIKAIADASGFVKGSVTQISGNVWEARAISPEGGEPIPVTILINPDPGQKTLVTQKQGIIESIDETEVAILAGVSIPVEGVKQFPQFAQATTGEDMLEQQLFIDTRPLSEDLIKIELGMTMLENISQLMEDINNNPTSAAFEKIKEQLTRMPQGNKEGDILGIMKVGDTVAGTRRGYVLSIRTRTQKHILLLVTVTPTEPEGRLSLVTQLPKSFLLLFEGQPDLQLAFAVQPLVKELLGQAATEKSTKQFPIVATEAILTQALTQEQLNALTAIPQDTWQRLMAQLAHDEDVSVGTINNELAEMRQANIVSDRIAVIQSEDDKYLISVTTAQHEQMLILVSTVPNATNTIMPALVTKLPEWVLYLFEEQPVDVLLAFAVQPQVKKLWGQAESWIPTDKNMPIVIESAVNGLRKSAPQLAAPFSPQQSITIAKEIAGFTEQLSYLGQVSPEALAAVYRGTELEYVLPNSVIQLSERAQEQGYALVKHPKTNIPVAAFYIINPTEEQARTASVVTNTEAEVGENEETIAVTFNPKLGHEFFASFVEAPEPTQDVWLQAVNESTTLQNQFISSAAKIGIEINPEEEITLERVTEVTGRLNVSEDLMLPSSSIEGLTIVEFIRKFYPPELHLTLAKQAQTLLGIRSLRTTKFNEFMRQASNEPDLNDTGYKLRQLLVNPIIERAARQGGISVINLAHFRNIDTVQELEGKTAYYDLGRLMLALFFHPEFSQNQEFYRALAEAATDLTSSEISNAVIEKITKEFQNYVLYLFSRGHITIIDYEKALRQTEALQTGIKPFAGKLGFISGKVRIMDNHPTYAREPSWRLEFIQAAAEEIIISFLAMQHEKAPTNAEISKLSSQIAVIAQRQSYGNLEAIKTISLMAPITPQPSLKPIQARDILMPAGELGPAGAVAKSFPSAAVFGIGTGILYGEAGKTQDVDTKLTTPLEQRNIRVVSVAPGLNVDEVLPKLAAVEVPPKPSGSKTEESFVQNIEGAQAIVVPVAGGESIIMVEPSGAYKVTEPLPIEGGRLIIISDPMGHISESERGSIVLDFNALGNISETEGVKRFIPYDLIIRAISILNILNGVTATDGQPLYHIAVYSNKYTEAEMRAMLGVLGEVFRDFKNTQTVSEAVQQISQEQKIRVERIVVTLAEATLRNNPNIIGKLAESLKLAMVKAPAIGEYASYKSILLNSLQLLAGIIPEAQLQDLREQIQNAPSIKSLTIEPEKDEDNLISHMQAAVSV